MVDDLAERQDTFNKKDKDKRFPETIEELKKEFSQVRRYDDTRPGDDRGSEKELIEFCKPLLEFAREHGIQDIVWGIGNAGGFPAIYIDRGPKPNNPEDGSKLGEIVYDDDRNRLWGEGWDPSEEIPDLFIEKFASMYYVVEPPHIMEKSPESINEIKKEFPNLKLAADSFFSNESTVLSQVWPILKLALLSDNGKSIQEIGTTDDLVDYVRMKTDDTRHKIAEIYHTYKGEKSIYWTENWDPGGQFSVGTIEIATNDPNIKRYEFDIDLEKDL